MKMYVPDSAAPRFPAGLPTFSYPLQPLSFGRAVSSDAPKIYTPEVGQLKPSWSSITEFAWRLQADPPKGWEASGTLSEATIATDSGVRYRKRVTTTIRHYWTSSPGGSPPPPDGIREQITTAERVINGSGNGWVTSSNTVTNDSGTVPTSHSSLISTTIEYFDPVDEFTIEPVVDQRLVDKEVNPASFLSSVYVPAETLTKVNISIDGVYRLKRFTMPSYTEIGSGPLDYYFYKVSDDGEPDTPPPTELDKPFHGTLAHLDYTPNEEIPPCSWEFARLTFAGGGIGYYKKYLTYEKEVVDSDGFSTVMRVSSPNLDLYIHNNSDVEQSYTVSVIINVYSGEFEGDVELDSQNITVNPSADSDVLSFHDLAHEFEGFTTVSDFFLKIERVDPLHIPSVEFKADNSFITFVKQNEYKGVRGVSTTVGGDIYSHSSVPGRGFVLTKNVVDGRARLGQGVKLDGSYDKFGVISDYASEILEAGFFTVDPVPTDLRVALLSNGECLGDDPIPLTGTFALPFSTTESATYVPIRDQIRILDVVGEHEYA